MPTPKHTKSPLKLSPVKRPVTSYKVSRMSMKRRSLPTDLKRKKESTKDGSPSGIRTRLSTGIIQMNGTSTVPIKEISSEASSQSSTSSSTKSEPPAVMARKRSVGSALTDNMSAGGMQLLPPKRRKIGKNNGTGEDNMNDYSCWICHKDGNMVCCELCPRVFHTKCLAVDNQLPPDWVCPECEKIMKAECMDTRSPAMSLIKLDTLCSLLKFSLDRMKHPGSTPFLNPVNLSTVPTYLDYVFYPMDLTILEKNIKKKMYGSTEAFLADAKWILHNCIVFNGVQDKLTASAKMIIKICKHEMNEIEVCPDCYLTSCFKNTDHWFAEPCRTPHTLVWAKLKGYPFWPAKALRQGEDQVDVRFFGAHDRAWVPVSQVYMLSKSPPTETKKSRGGFEEAMAEVKIHIEKIREKFGSFEYAGFRTPYDKHNVYYHNKLKKLPKSPKKGKKKSPSHDSSRRGFKNGKIIETKPSERQSAVAKTASALKNKYNTARTKKVTVYKQTAAGVFMITETKPCKEALTLSPSKATNIPKVKLPDRNIIEKIESKIVTLSKEDDDENLDDDESQTNDDVDESHMETASPHSNTSVNMEQNVSSSSKTSEENHDESVSLLNGKSEECSDNEGSDTSSVNSCISSGENSSPCKQEYADKLKQTIETCKAKLGLPDDSQLNDEEAFAEESDEEILAHVSDSEQEGNSDVAESSNSTVEKRPDDITINKKSNSEIDVKVGENVKTKSNNLLMEDETELESSVSSSINKLSESHASDKSGVTTEDSSDPKDDEKSTLVKKDNLTTNSLLKAASSTQVVTEEKVTSLISSETCSLSEKEVKSQVLSTDNVNEYSVKIVDSSLKSDLKCVDSGTGVSVKSTSSSLKDETEGFKSQIDSTANNKEHLDKSMHGTENNSSSKFLDKDSNKNLQSKTQSETADSEMIKTNQSLQSNVVSSLTLTPPSKDDGSDSKGDNSIENGWAADGAAKSQSVTTDEEKSSKGSSNLDLVISSVASLSYSVQEKLSPTSKNDKNKNAENSSSVKKTVEKMSPPRTVQKFILPKTSPQTISSTNKSTPHEVKKHRPVAFKSTTKGAIRKHLASSGHSSQSQRVSPPQTTSPTPRYVLSSQRIKSEVETVSPTLPITSPQDKNSDGGSVVGDDLFMEVETAASDENPLTIDLGSEEEEGPTIQPVQIIEKSKQTSVVPKPAVSTIKSSMVQVQVQPVNIPADSIIQRVLPTKEKSVEPTLPPKQSAGNASSLQAVTGEICNKYSSRLVSNLNSTLALMCEEITAAVQKNQPKPTSSPDMSEQIKKMKWEHQQELEEIKHNFQLTILEMQACWEAEKDRIIVQAKKEFQKEMDKTVAETKKKQWCAHCGKEAVFYCCWNTSYCDYPCQQSHWPDHMHSCMQANQTSEQTDAPSDKLATDTSQQQKSMQPKSTDIDQSQSWVDKMREGLNNALQQQEKDSRKPSYRFVPCSSTSQPPNNNTAMQANTQPIQLQYVQQQLSMNRPPPPQYQNPPQMRMQVHIPQNQQNITNFGPLTSGIPPGGNIIYPVLQSPHPHRPMPNNNTNNTQQFVIAPPGGQRHPASFLPVTLPLQPRPPF